MVLVNHSENLVCVLFVCVCGNYSVNKHVMG